MSWYEWKPYVSVAERRRQAAREMARLRKAGKKIQPIELDSRTIARSFWGKGWCDHLEAFSDFENRLPRGRTYVRNGSVCHLEIRPGKAEAIVSGSELYNVKISIAKLKPAIWKSVKARCTGQIGSMLELLQGKLSSQVMAVVSDARNGLFPSPAEIKFDCDCPDWAYMCKHVAAVLYGVGARLDDAPELLFTLRGVDPQELISAEIGQPTPGTATTGATIDEDQLGAVFGIELDEGSPAPMPVERQTPASTTAGKATERRSTPKTGKGPTKPAAKRSAAVNLRPTGKSVVRLRKRLGLSVADFAQRLGVSEGSVYRWESQIGRLKLHSRPLKALAALTREAKGRGKGS